MLDLVHLDNRTYLAPRAYVLDLFGAPEALQNQCQRQGRWAEVAVCSDDKFSEVELTSPDRDSFLIWTGCMA